MLTYLDSDQLLEYLLIVGLPSFIIALAPFSRSYHVEGTNALLSAQSSKGKGEPLFAAPINLGRKCWESLYDGISQFTPSEHNRLKSKADLSYHVPAIPVQRQKGESHWKP